MKKLQSKIKKSVSACTMGAKPFMHKVLMSVALINTRWKLD